MTRTLLSPTIAATSLPAMSNAASLTSARAIFNPTLEVAAAAEQQQAITGDRFAAAVSNEIYVTRNEVRPCCGPVDDAQSEYPARSTAKSDGAYALCQLDGGSLANTTCSASDDGHSSAVNHWMHVGVNRRQNLDPSVG